MSQEQIYAVAISTPLSNEAKYIKLNDLNLSVDSAISQMIDALKSEGKTLEAEQLSNLYGSHQIFSNNAKVEKGDLFKNLAFSPIQSDGKTIQLIKLDLVAAHSGGH